MFYGAVGVFFSKFGCENKKISETYLQILCLVLWCLEYAFAYNTLILTGVCTSVDGFMNKLEWEMRLWG